MPAPVGVYGRDGNGASESTVTVCGVRYEPETLNLLYERPTSESVYEQDFVADDSLGLYYAGDFCSARCPGFEAAALSAVDAAAHMAAVLLKK